jgi:hypothetical protein
MWDMFGRKHAGLAMPLVDRQAGVAPGVEVRGYGGSVKNMVNHILKLFLRIL